MIIKKWLFAWNYPRHAVAALNGTDLLATIKNQELCFDSVGSVLGILCPVSLVVLAAVRLSLN